MENEASKTRSLNNAFLVDSETLRNLDKLLSKLKGALEYKVKFSDGSTVKYLDVDDIISQPNSGTRFIVSVIAGVEGRLGLSAFLTMRNDPEPSVEYTVNGPQRDVFYFAGKLDDWIQSCRQWYSAFFSSSLSTVVAIGAFALPFFLADRAGCFFPSHKSWLPLTTMIAAGVAEYWTVKLFPRGTFAIGYGAKRHQLLSAVRTTVLAGFLVSVLASSLATWLTRHF